MSPICILLIDIILMMFVIHLYNKTVKYEECKDWCEIDGIKYLFHPSQPWQYQQVNQFTRTLALIQLSLITLDINNVEDALVSYRGGLEFSLC